MVDEKKDKKYKCSMILLGQTLTGKTSLYEKYLHQTFDENQLPTNGINSALKILKFPWVSSEPFEYTIYDTTSNNHFMKKMDGYMRQVDIVCLVYDISRRDTFEKAYKRYAFFRESIRKNPNIIICMVANKRDLNTQIAVDHDELVAFTERHNFLYKEVSAKTGDGVIDMFASLFFKAIEKKYGIHINPNYYEPKPVFTRRKGV